MCDKCVKYILRHYKYCPKCGDDLIILDREANKGLIFSPLEYESCKYWLTSCYNLSEYEFDILWFKYLCENIINGKPSFEFYLENDILYMVNRSSPTHKDLVTQNSRLCQIVDDIKKARNPFDLLSDRQKQYFLLHRQKLLEDIVKQQNDIIRDLL